MVSQMAAQHEEMAFVLQKTSAGTLLELSQAVRHHDGRRHDSEVREIVCAD